MKPEDMKFDFLSQETCNDRDKMAKIAKYVSHFLNGDYDKLGVNEDDTSDDIY